MNFNAINTKWDWSSDKQSYHISLVNSFSHTLMTMSSLLFSQSFNNPLSHLLISPFTSLRKPLNIPPTTKTTIYPTSYIHPVFPSVTVKEAPLLESNISYSTWTPDCTTFHLLKTSLLCSNSLPEPQSYWINPIRARTPVVAPPLSLPPEKETINFLSHGLTIPMVLKLLTCI